MPTLVGAAFPLFEACEVLKSKKHSDFTLICEGYKFPIHRLILSQKSSFFQAAFDDDFREKSDGQMTIGDTSPEALASVIVFCYTNELQPNKSLAAFPDLPCDKEVAEPSREFRDRLLDIYLLADRLLLPSLAKMACIEFFNDLWEDNSPEDEPSPVFAKRIYQLLPASDAIFKPLLTAWGVVESRDPGDGDSNKASLRRLVEEEDPHGYRAARYMDSTRTNGRDYWKAADQALNWY